jgi:hypothetical protein
MKPAGIMGSAELEGALWGARAGDWVHVQQRTIRPVSFAVLDELGPWQGRPLLDIGCGAGDFAGLAGGLDAVVSGLDACAAFIDIARERIPSGRFLVGDPTPAGRCTEVAASTPTTTPSSSTGSSGSTSQHSNSTDRLRARPDIGQTA